MTAATPGQAAPLHFTYDGCMAVQCFAGDPDAEFGDTVTFVDPGDSWDQVAAKVREHQAEHGCAAQDARPAPEVDVNRLPVTPAAAKLYNLCSAWEREAFRIPSMLGEKDARARALMDCAVKLRASVNDLRRDGEL